MELVAESAGAGGILVGEVSGFGGIFSEVIQFEMVVFEVFEELPVAGAEGGDRGGGGVIVRVMEEEVFAGEAGGWVAKEGQQIEAVSCAGRNGDPSGGAKEGEEVGGDNGFGGDRVGRGDVGPVDDERDA